MKQPVDEKMKDFEVDPFIMLDAQSSQIKKELDKMLEDKIISADQYNKEIVLLSYSYALNGFPDDCILMLLNVKPEYFKNMAIQHFKEDREFFAKASLIFEVLSHIGYVPFDVMATQKIAIA